MGVETAAERVRTAVDNLLNTSFPTLRRTGNVSPLDTQMRTRSSKYCRKLIVAIVALLIRLVVVLD